MSSETDHPRQRTVAELLAAHGDGTATGRRARRRAAENAGQSEPGAASGGYPVAGANSAPSGAAPGAPPLGGVTPAGPSSGSFPAVGGPEPAAPTSGSFPAVGGPDLAAPTSGSFPAVGGPPATPSSGPFPAATPNSGSFPAVGGPSAAPTSGQFPAVGEGPHSGSFPAVNGTGANGRPAPPNGAPGPGGWGPAEGVAPGNGAPSAGGWGPADAPNGAPSPATWSTGDGPHGPANGGPGGWGVGDGSAAPAYGGPGARGAGGPNGSPAGPATWGGDGAAAQDDRGYSTWGAADGALAPPGTRPSPRGRGPRPGGPPDGGGWGSADPNGGPPARTDNTNSGPPAWADNPNGAPAARSDEPGGAPRRGGPVTPWGPDSETDPEMPEAGDGERPGRNGRAAGPRKSTRPSPPRTPNPSDGPPNGDAAFVNGGAVYSDPYRPQREPDAEATHRIGDRQRPAAPRRRSDRTTMLDPGQTGPIAPRPLVDDDGGPSTAVGLAPAGAEDWHRHRTARRGGWNGGAPADGSAPFHLDDDVQDEYDEGDHRGATERVGHLDRQDDEPDDHPAGLAAEPGVRPAGSSPGQAWAAVVAQWIAGAIGGAALWVGFRFLWRDLPVVALAAAVLVTVGLVLVVRALMHNDDRRTTLFAVLVGLLLTVSPAILVLLGR